MTTLKYITFHGFNVSDGGKDTIAQLDPFLDTIPVKYQWVWLARVRLCNRCIASSLVSLIPEDSVAVAHSNGALIATESVELGAPFRKLILINPALDEDYKFPEGLRVDVYYTPKETATLAAKFIPWSKWGAMGRLGYTGDNPLVHNYNSEHLFGSVEHSDVFDRAEDLANHIKGGCETLPNRELT